MGGPAGPNNNKASPKNKGGHQKGDMNEHILAASDLFL
jgi:hypothetical protein